MENDMNVADYNIGKEITQARRNSWKTRRRNWLLKTLKRILRLYIVIAIGAFGFYHMFYYSLIGYLKVEMQKQSPIVSVVQAQEEIVVKPSVIHEVTMYTSTPEQTDATPCIGSTGEDICVLWKNGQNICATNSEPIGTVLHIDKLGDCLVKDRMNSRFTERIDWYAGYDNDCLNGVGKRDVCPNYKRAVLFGVQRLGVSVN